MELAKNGVLAELSEQVQLPKPHSADHASVPAIADRQTAFSIRHTTRNFLNREGSKITERPDFLLHLLMHTGCSHSKQGTLYIPEELNGSYSEHNISFTQILFMRIRI